MDAKQLGVLALIPAYNEAAGIAAVVAEAREYLPVLVVDDGSRDDTASLAESAGRGSCARRRTGARVRR